MTNIKCTRCHRPLKSAESIARGCGLTCAKKEGLIKVKKRKKKKKSIPLLSFKED